MNKKQLIVIFSGIVLVLIGILVKRSIIFTNSEVILLKSVEKIAYEDSYISLDSFILENDIVKLELSSPLGTKEQWKELMELSVSGKQYQLKTNVVEEVSEEGSLYLISCIGEVLEINSLQQKPDEISLKTKFGEIYIDYVIKNKLYY